MVNVINVGLMWLMWWFMIPDDHCSILFVFGVYGNLC